MFFLRIYLRKENPIKRFYCATTGLVPANSSYTATICCHHWCLAKNPRNSYLYCVTNFKCQHYGKITRRSSDINMENKLDISTRVRKILRNFDDVVKTSIFCLAHAACDLWQPTDNELRCNYAHSRYDLPIEPCALISSGVDSVECVAKSISRKCVCLVRRY